MERSQIIPLIDETRQLVKTGRIVSQVASATIATGVIAAGVGVGIAGYAFYNWVNDFTPWEDVKTWWNTKKEAVYDSPLWNPIDDIVAASPGPNLAKDAPDEGIQRVQDDPLSWSWPFYDPNNPTLFNWDGE